MKPYEFITMLCAVASTGIAVVGMVAYLLTWVTEDIDELKEDVDGLKTEVVAVRTDVDGLKTDVAAVRDDVVELKTVVGNHAELLAAVSSRQAGPFLALKPGGEKELTYFQPWAPESSEANEAQSLWDPFLDRLKGDGYNIETLTPSPFSALQ